MILGGKSAMNLVELLRELDEINLETARIDNNINQFAKYVNQRKEAPGDALLQDFNFQVGDYIRTLRKLQVVYLKITAL